MRIRRVGVAALTSALALSGLMAGSVGVASAAKPVLQGSLMCTHIGGQTAVSPGIVSQKSDLTPPKFKDKKPKYTTSGTGSGCTGTSTSGTTPTSFTLTSKAKGDSRVLIHPASECPTVGQASKTKITFNTGAKLKAVLTTDLNTYAFDPIGQHVTASFPPCGSSYETFAAFVVAHPNDRIMTFSSGHSLGKAYAPDPNSPVPGLIFMQSVTTETILQVGTQADTTGVVSQHTDPVYSNLIIGLCC